MFVHLKDNVNMYLKRQSVKPSLLKSYLLLDSAALFSQEPLKHQKTCGGPVYAMHVYK
jgi:hypothetical protein